MGLRKLSPGGHEYLTNSVACADRDRELEPGELFSDYYLSRGYPAGQWFGAGAVALGLSGEVTAAHMNALFGEGRHPHADAIETEKIADGATADEALRATRLGRRFPQYSGLDHMRSQAAQAYKDYNREHNRPIGAPISADKRAALRHGVQVEAFTKANRAAPEDEKELQKWLAEQKRSLKSAVSGFEMVLAPDKSVSIAWAMANPIERKLIAGMVHQAARDTLSYVERNAAFTRRGNMGEAQVDVNGIAAALFEHWDSRASDPHLHIHALISSKVQRSDDGEWTALDGRTILAATVTASEYFDSRLRDLFREQGAAWTQRGAGGVDLRRPVWQLAGVPVELVKTFSQRHRQFEAARAKRIVEFRKTHDREPKPKEIFAIDRAAQYDNRPGKQPPKTLPEHVRAWREHAETVVSSSILAVLGRRVFLTGPVAHGPVDITSLALTTRAIVSDNYTHFSWWNLSTEAHRQSAHLSMPPDKREQLIDDVVATVLAEPDTLALAGPVAVTEPASLRRRDGESVFVERRSTRYTTTATLAAEGDLVAWAHRGGGHRLRADTVEKALAGKKLNAGQTRMVREFARSGRRLQLALAPAGAGKTTAMKVLATAWRRTGHRVYAFGPSARAAQELGSAIGATPHTLHQLTTTKRLGFAHRAFPIKAGDLVIIDEAAMSGVHTLHAVAKYMLHRGADVRLIGDDAQLAAVEAGGAIRLIAHDVGALRFQEVVRFQGPDSCEQAAASLQIRNGDPRGLEYYFDQHRVEDGSLETMRDAAHAGWRADLDRGAQSLLIVPTNEDTVALNLEAREVRLHRGDITRGREVALHDATTAGVGDWVVTRHNQRLLSLFGGRDFVKNGDVWTVKSVHHSGRITITHRAHKGTITLPAGYVQTHVELAYAATVNRVQGMTSTGNAHLLVPPTMTREQFYPGITRAMLKNFLYVITHHHVIDQHQETPEPQTPKAVLTGVLNHSGAEISATETLREKQDEAVSMGTLVLRYNYTATYRDDDRYCAVLAHRAPTTVDQSSEPALIQTLRNAHDLGWQPDHLVTTALRRSSLDKADDAGAVLQKRISTYIENNAPPTPTAPPQRADVTRWRDIIDAIAPHTAVEDPQWSRVWQRAAGALTVGFDIDAALTVVAHQLAARPDGPDPMPDDRYADAALAAEIDRRTDHGEAHQRAVPWLARPDFAHVRHHPGHTQYLHEMNTAIASRADELRATAIRTPPGWTARLGPRPDNPIAAEDWDDLVGLTAAYRETFHITSDDPAHPLGRKPGSHGARAHTWHTLAARWDAPAQKPRSAESTDNTITETEELDLDSVFAEFEQAEERYITEPLNVLVRKYDLHARDGDEDRYLDILARYVPGAINAGAEPAALAALSRAQDHGWQAERLVRAVTDPTSFSWAMDPAAVLAKRVSTHIADHEPPALIGVPNNEQIAQWRNIVTGHLPEAPVESDRWGIVWRHAAGGNARGLDADAALTAAAAHLAETGSPAENRDPLRTGESLVAELAAQYDTGAGHHPALPWLAVADHGRPGDPSSRIERLDALNAEITERVSQLREDVVHQHPAWAELLGDRPTEPHAARRWDSALSLAAAYRETFHITGNDPQRPLGVKPGSPGAKAHAWATITNQWRDIMAIPNDPEDQQSDALLSQEATRDARDGMDTAALSDTAAAETDRHDDEQLQHTDDEVAALDTEANDLRHGLSY